MLADIGFPKIDQAARLAAPQAMLALEAEVTSLQYSSPIRTNRTAGVSRQAPTTHIPY